MAEMTPLSEVCEELGYPRSYFIKSIMADKIYDKFNTSLDLDDDFYVVITDDNEISLVRSKKGGMLTTVTEQASTHVYSAIVKYIILKKYDLNLKIDMILYILYYTTKYRAINDLTDSELTDGVIIHISNIIKLMIEREDTTYRNKSEIGEAIEELRRTLTFERARLGIRQKINLRR